MQQEAEHIKHVKSYNALLSCGSCELHICRPFVLDLNYFKIQILNTDL